MRASSLSLFVGIGSFGDSAAGPGAVGAAAGFLNLSSRLSGVISREGLITTAFSQKLRSSLMLPGHGYFFSASSAPAENLTGSVEFSFAK